MASVDDIEELIAIRKLNGLNDDLYKENNIEEDIKILEDENQEIYDFAAGKINKDWKKAYKNIIDFSKNALVEREQNKKRIKELDADLTTAYLKGYADAEEKYRQKIKDKIEKIFTVLYENYENDYEDIQDVISEIHIKLKKELLEEDK